MTDDALRADRDRLLVMLADWCTASYKAAALGRTYGVPAAVADELRGRLGDVTDARDRLAKGATG